jgi:hypothetical protein
VISLLSRESRSTAGPADPFRYPRSHTEWVAWYEYRIDAYHGENYPAEIVKALHLFRALDDDGQEIAITRRIHRDIQFVVEVASAALALPQVTLQVAAEATAQEKALAERIWQATMLAEVGPQWAWTLANCGDLYLEPAQIAPGDYRIVSHDPRTVYAPYDDALGVQIQRAVITHKILPEGSVDPHGVVTEVGEMIVHQRTLTTTDITVEQTAGPSAPSLLRRTESVVDETASGSHSLKCCPLVHVYCLPSSQRDHGLWAGHALDRPLAEVDSLACQISAIGDRFANPKMVVIGAQISAGDTSSRFGRIINIWGPNAKDAKVNYLEADLSGVERIAQRLDATLASARATLPEFQLFGGSNLSGEALRLMQTRFQSKYEDIRGRLYRGLARAVAMGVDLALRRPYDPHRTWLTVEGPPLLPSDVAAEVGVLKVAKDAGMLSDVDAVRHSQRLGLASSEQSPEDYAADLADRAAEKAASFFGDEPPGGVGKKPPIAEDEDEDDGGEE